MLRAPAEGCLFFYVRPAGSVYWQGDSFCNTRACLKNHFRNLHAPLCGICYPHSVAVARYAALIRIKSPTNWDSQLTKSLFQTRSKVQNIVSILEWRILWFWCESCPRVCCRGLCRQHRRCWFRYGEPGRRGDRRGWWRWRGHQRC